MTPRRVQRAPRPPNKHPMWPKKAPGRAQEGDRELTPLTPETASGHSYHLEKPGAGPATKPKFCALVQPPGDPHGVPREPRGSLPRGRLLHRSAVQLAVLEAVDPRRSGQTWPLSPPPLNSGSYASPLRKR